MNVKGIINALFGKIVRFSLPSPSVSPWLDPPVILAVKESPGSLSLSFSPRGFMIALEMIQWSKILRSEMMAGWSLVSAGMRGVSV